MDGLGYAGVDSERLCRESGLDRAALQDPGLRIPYTTLDALLERAVSSARTTTWGCTWPPSTW